MVVIVFKQSKKESILQSFDWYNQNFLDKCYNEYSLNERLNYGFPISLDEYSNNIKKLILSLSNNFNLHDNYRLDYFLSKRI